MSFLLACESSEHAKVVMRERGECWIDAFRGENVRGERGQKTTMWKLYLIKILTTRKSIINYPRLKIYYVKWMLWTRWVREWLQFACDIVNVVVALHNNIGKRCLLFPRNNANRIINLLKRDSEHDDSVWTGTHRNGPERKGMDVFATWKKNLRNISTLLVFSVVAAQRDEANRIELVNRDFIDVEMRLVHDIALLIWHKNETTLRISTQQTASDPQFDLVRVLCQMSTRAHNRMINSAMSRIRLRIAVDRQKEGSQVRLWNGTTSSSSSTSLLWVTLWVELSWELSAKPQKYDFCQMQKRRYTLAIYNGHSSWWRWLSLLLRRDLCDTRRSTADDFCQLCSLCDAPSSLIRPFQQLWQPAILIENSVEHVLSVISGTVISKETKMTR